MAPAAVTAGRAGRADRLKTARQASSRNPKSRFRKTSPEAAGKEDQVARQIREAAEQEEDPRIRDALWDEYRKHMGLKRGGN